MNKCLSQLRKQQRLRSQTQIRCLKRRHPLLHYQHQRHRLISMICSVLVTLLHNHRTTQMACQTNLLWAISTLDTTSRPLLLIILTRMKMLITNSSLTKMIRRMIRQRSLDGPTWELSPMEKVLVRKFLLISPALHSKKSYQLPKKVNSRRVVSRLRPASAEMKILSCS